MGLSLGSDVGGLVVMVMPETPPSGRTRCGYTGAGL